MSMNGMKGYARLNVRKVDTISGCRSNRVAGMPCYL